MPKAAKNSFDTADTKGPCVSLDVHGHTSRPGGSTYRIIRLLAMWFPVSTIVVNVGDGREAEGVAVESGPFKLGQRASPQFVVVSQRVVVARADMTRLLTIVRPTTKWAVAQLGRVGAT